MSDGQTKGALSLVRVSRAKFWLAAALAALCLCAAASGQGRADATSAPFSQAPYRVGERLTYTVSFSNFPTAAHIETLVAGRGQLQGREGIELRGHVETIGVVSAALLALNVNQTTFVDPFTGLPYRAQQSLRQGMRVQDVSQEYNTPLGNSALTQGRDVAVTAGTFDFLSALYRLRALPLAQGATYAFSVKQGESVYDAEVKVTGRETLKTNVGSSNTIVAEVRVRGNKEADEYRVRLYFIDDERHVPVLISARHRAGEIRIELASAEFVSGTQDPLASATPSPTPADPGIRLPPGQLAGNNPPRATPTPAATPAPGPGAAAPPADLPFKPGEQLNFNFFLGPNSQPAGSASFLVRPRARYFNREGLLLTANLQTAGAVQALFPVSDQINSYVDASSVLPFRTELTLAEGKRRARFVVSADQQGGAALFEDGTRVEMPFGTHDLLSVFYALRSFDLSPGKRNSVSLLVNKRPRILFITALRNAPVQLGGQTIPAVELALATSDAAGDRLALRLWVSTDKRRLPLRLTAMTPLGPVRADLAIIPTSLQ
ncbi:MAG TPA: DUF3108 domain-containing protein [Pyrinomonadaceae bacterium]|nr:DUF3108 domain-containing protein [Pyrinomonadaceae bacterium]